MAQGKRGTANDTVQLGLTIPKTLKEKLEALALKHSVEQNRLFSLQEYIRVVLQEKCDDASKESES